MKKTLSILLVCFVLFLGTANAETLYGSIDLQEIKSLEDKYLNKIAVVYYTLDRFISETGLSSSDAKDWVFLIDFENNYIAMSDSYYCIIVYTERKGTLQYANDVLTWRINLLDEINNLLLQSENVTKFSLLEARNAKKAGVDKTISAIANAKDIIDLSNSENRNILLDVWKSNNSTSEGFQEFGDSLSELDTNGNGIIEPEELFGN